jgi:6,7-dimethyl-8-ribityllumazine synthase
MLRGTRSARSCLAMGTAALAALLLVACHKALPPDGVCSYEALPAGAQVPSGQGGIQVLASTDAYFAMREATGKQIASGHVNAITPVAAGDYQVVVNNSTHAISAKSKMLTRCTTGAVLVNGKTDEYYAVLDQAGRQLASAHVASALSLFPGSYTVRLNNIDVAANLQAGAMLELKPGTVNVDVGTDEYYAVLDASTRQLASSHVGRALGLFAGSYTVRINNSDARAAIRAGESTNVPAGTLVVRGSTDEYYAVMNNAGVQLASAHLEKPLAFVPGTYNVKLNNTITPATMVSGVTIEVKTGAVVLQGSTDEYYAIVDSAGTQLASAHLGHALSLVPGAYRAKLNNIAMTVQVDAGHSGEYQSGSLTVKTAGSDYYAVLDATGTQLASKQVNQPVSLPAGRYSVRLGNNIRPATVPAGQSVVLNW